MQEIIISAKQSKLKYWLDIWQNKELFWILAKRDVSVRYKQTAVGALWSVLRPLATVLASLFVFGKIAKLPSEPNTPYAIMVFSGVLIWTFFAQSLQQISSSLVANSNLISKVYFPRLIIPASSLLIGIVDLVISFSVFLLLCVWYDFYPSWQIVLLPIFVLMAFLSALGVGLFMAVLNVRYRDINHIVPFILQFGFYACPVAFSSNTTVHGKWWEIYYNLNPLVGIIDACRWSLLGGNAPFMYGSITPSIVFIVVTLFIGIRYFRSQEDTFVDYI